ncbi:pro-resilin-like [Penaeus monodon]|uniref:pro-resilin-like n=1 Tax=Penaeus monodon TaxID=6687 RepID=UPI0018A7432A|nr:pro-resilin-like [Penaeus monodon]
MYKYKKKHTLTINKNTTHPQGLIVVAALVAMAVARPEDTPGYGYSAPASGSSPAQYDFNYAVKDDYSSNDFGHQEDRDGYDTRGSYYVLLPDGRLQKVTYSVNSFTKHLAKEIKDQVKLDPLETLAY